MLCCTARGATQGTSSALCALLYYNTTLCAISYTKVYTVQLYTQEILAEQRRLWVPNKAGKVEYIPSCTPNISQLIKWGFSRTEASSRAPNAICGVHKTYSAIEQEYIPYQTNAVCKVKYIPAYSKVYNAVCACHKAFCARTWTRLRPLYRPVFSCILYRAIFCCIMLYYLVPDCGIGLSRLHFSLPLTNYAKNQPKNQPCKGEKNCRDSSRDN